ncbi:hypothetical protein [Pontiella sulfatireligans]|uniref:PEP-CTERM protein-sorting domain-containing protein n=1 Tax=Pontiella sulfatireligans TaxID=2750658 RepID=A0A6C2UTP4_9BACT|nr:hypothetical protein [Pontiella sulfatireligans]VGO23539.1 hypothetical protein SCARR_05646 [Pontiella sulfatireligans]
MKKIKFGICAVALIGAMSAQASVIFELDSGQAGLTRQWVATDLNNTAPTVTGDNTPQAGGTFSAAGNIDLAASITFNFSAASNWNASAAQANITAGTFGTYISGLTAATVDGGGNSLSGEPIFGFGVDNGDGLGNGSTLEAQGEVLFLEVKNSGLSVSQSVLLQQVDFNLMTAGDRTDFLVYNKTDNTITFQEWDMKYNGTTAGSPIDDGVGGSWVLNDGDIVVMGVGVSGGPTEKWRAADFTFDVIPEPATLGMVAACGAGILFIRRRFML